MEENGLNYMAIGEDDFKLENFELKDERLYYHEKEVAVIYFRYFYDSSHYYENSMELMA